MVRKGFRVGMEPSTASEEVKGSERAKGREIEHEEEKNNTDEQTRSCRISDTDIQKWRRIYTIPPHGVDSEGPGCMDDWKLLFKSKRSLSIFKVLGIKKKQSYVIGMKFLFYRVLLYLLDSSNIISLVLMFIYNCYI